MPEPRSVLASIVWLTCSARRRRPFDGFHVDPLDWRDLGVVDGDVLEVWPLGVAGVVPLRGVVVDGDTIRVSSAPPRAADYVQIVVGRVAENA